MNISQRYLELKVEYDAACEQLQRLAYVLKDTGRRLDHRPDEPLDFKVPDNATLQAAQTRRAEARAAALEAWAAMPQAERVNFVPIR